MVNDGLDILRDHRGLHHSCIPLIIMLIQGSNSLAAVPRSWILRGMRIQISRLVAAIIIRD